MTRHTLLLNIDLLEHDSYSTSERRTYTLDRIRCTLQIISCALSEVLYESCSRRSIAIFNKSVSVNEINMSQRNTSITTISTVGGCVSTVL